MEGSEDQKSAVLSYRKAWKNAPWVPISKIQAQKFRERPLKGPIVVSKVIIPRPKETEASSYDPGSGIFSNQRVRAPKSLTRQLHVLHTMVNG
jgi:hypothetical protein